MHPALSKELGWIGNPSQRESQTQLSALVGVPADECRLRGVECFHDTGEELFEHALHLVFRSVRQRDDRQGRPRIGAHRVDVPETVVGRDLPK